MRLFLCLLWACLVVNTLQQKQCDPLTQYDNKGQCCQMCGKGTSMPPNPDCQHPVCVACGDDEYQDGYTREVKCKLQKYCDPHLNFEDPVHPSNTEEHICRCMQGFHCSGDTCATCSPHSVCGKGHQVKHKGNHSHDTVCEKCAEGTFSSSQDGVCRAWTACEPGSKIQQAGTADSDNVCVKPLRLHLIVGIIVGLVVFVLLIGFIYWKYRGTIKEKVKHYFCNDFREEEHHELKNNDTCINMQETQKQTQPILPEQESTQEEYSVPEGHVQTPVENLEEESQDFGNYTENGNFVTQEKGKSEILSRQESQTHSSVQTNPE